MDLIFGLEISLPHGRLLLAVSDTQLFVSRDRILGWDFDLHENDQEFQTIVFSLSLIYSVLIMYSPSGKPIITMPIKIIRVIEKARQRRLDRMKTYRQIYGVDRHVAPVVISCRNRGMNHYAGQRYPDGRLLLATESWKGKKCEGDFFTIITARKIVEGDEEPRQKHPFQEMAQHLSKPILTAIEELGLKKMTLIQRKAIPVIVSGRNTLMASEMGSGKSVAFLTPIIERLVRLRKTDGEPQAGCPRAIILTPTKELGEQLGTISRQILLHSQSIDFVTLRSDNQNVFAPELEQPGRDLLIASVGNASRYKKMGSLKFDDLRHVVVDEADTLLHESVRDGLFRLLTDIKFNKTSYPSSKGSAQLILVASTIPDDLQDLMNPLLGDGNLVHVTNEYIHRLQPHLRHRFLRIDRLLAPEALLSHVKRDVENKRRVAVLIRDPKTCEWLEHFLEESGVHIVALRGTMSEEKRSQSYQRIMDGDFSVMVATDAAILGLDTRYLDHVINYQVPETIGGYLRRAGRVGRVNSASGRFGLVTTFVTNPWEVDLVQELETSVRLNQALSVNDKVKDRLDFEE